MSYLLQLGHFPKLTVKTLSLVNHINQSLWLFRLARSARR